MRAFERSLSWHTLKCSQPSNLRHVYKHHWVSFPVPVSLTSQCSGWWTPHSSLGPNYKVNASAKFTPKTTPCFFGLHRRHGGPGWELVRHLGSLFFLLLVAFDLNWKNLTCSLRFWFWQFESPDPLLSARAEYLAWIHFNNNIHSFTQVGKQRKPF